MGTAEVIQAIVTPIAAAALIWAGRWLAKKVSELLAEQRETNKLLAEIKSNLDRHETIIVDLGVSDTRLKERVAHLEGRLNIPMLEEPK